MRGVRSNVGAGGADSTCQHLALSKGSTNIRGVCVCVCVSEKHDDLNGEKRKKRLVAF